MRHRRQAKYFGRKSAHRKAMFRNMVTSFFEHGRIKTTLPRAKELRRWAERLITLAKDGSLHARRQALEVIVDKGVVAKLFNEIAEEMRGRNGGYTRIVRIGPRRGDAAMMCYIELVSESLKKEAPSKPKAEEEEAVAPTVIPEAKEESKEEVKEEEVKEEARDEAAEKGVEPEAEDSHVEEHESKEEPQDDVEEKVEKEKAEEEQEEKASQDEKAALSTLEEVKSENKASQESENKKE